MAPELAADGLAPGLELAVADALGPGRDADRRPHPVEVDPRVARVDADLGGDPVAVAGGEVPGDLDDLAEQVDVGREGGDDAVQEKDVLHEEHQLLGQLRPVGEQVPW